jgi:hypothetical protein
MLSINNITKAELLARLVLLGEFGKYLCSWYTPAHILTKFLEVYILFFAT